MRRSVFDQVGGVDETLSSAEDYDLCLRLSEVTEIRHVDKPLYAYRVHDESESQAAACSRSWGSTRRSTALRRRGMDATARSCACRSSGKFSLLRESYERQPSSRMIGPSRVRLLTHSTIRSGCGEYSSSMLTVRSNPVSRIAAGNP